MPHLSVALRCAVAWRVAVVALLGLAACAPHKGEVRVSVDSTMGAGGVEVLALPFDPALLAAAPVPRPTSRPATDSVARYYALADSADSANAVFQRARVAVNSAVRTSRSADRRAPAYDSLFRVLSQRADSAEALRAHRDSLLARQKKLGGRLHVIPARPATVRTARAADSAPSLRASFDSAARSAGRGIVRAPVAGRQATLALPQGDWWLALSDGDGGVVLPGLPLHVTSGAHLGATLTRRNR